MIYKYFLEIKNRLILIIFTWISTVFICYKYKEILLFIFIVPSLNYFKIKSLYFIFTNLTEIFYTYLQLCYFIANQITYIFLFYHLIIFISPALYNFEYKKLKKTFFLIIFFWIISIILLNILILPYIWKFFLSFQKPLLNNNQYNIYYEAKLDEYLKLYISVYFLSFTICQFFVFIFILLNYLKNSLNFIKISRKFFYFFFFIFATVITPPEILSQITLGLFIILCYEFLILCFILKLNFNLVTN